MKTGMAALLIAAGSLMPAAGAPDLPAGPRWSLVWSDEFNGNQLDSSKWTARDQDPRGEGAWSRNTVSLDGAGHLVFAVKERNGRLITGGIDTRGKFETNGGFIVVRCKLPPNARYRPAFWIQSDSVRHVGDGGRDGTEIDVMEQQPGKVNKAIATLHWDGYGRDHKGANREAPQTLDAGWHTFAVWWSDSVYTFYLDGREYWKTDAGGVSRVPEMLKLGIETPWALSTFADRTIDATDKFVVDYVRVYKAR